MVSRRVGAVCGIAGPLSFVSAWAVGGLIRDGYDPLSDAISQLAREGVPTRPLMTTGLVAFGVLVPVWSIALSRELRSRALLPVVSVAGLATLAVAALPLTREEGGTQDTLHAVAAGIGYVAMSATPLVGAAALRRLGHDRAAATSAVVGAVSVAALVGTLLVADRSGGLQRLGLTVVDAWHVAVATWVLRRARR